MKKLLLFVSAACLTFTSCSTHRSIGNGAYSDISLVRNSDQYEIKRLNEVDSESRAIFGIPVDGGVAKKEGIIFRFNGINVKAQSKFWPTVSMAALTFVTGSTIYGIAGSSIDNREVGYLVSGIAAIPIAGALNNQIWSDAAFSRASWNANSILLDENPDVDVFLNPKYEIETSNGFWSQRVRLRARVMGATILTED